MPSDIWDSVSHTPHHTDPIEQAWDAHSGKYPSGVARQTAAVWCIPGMEGVRDGAGDGEGLLAQMTLYILRSSVMPVPHISFMGALAAMTALCGRSYNTYTGAGLSMYMLLLAETGRGKEAAQRGITQLIQAAMEKTPRADTLLGPAMIQSAPGLLRHLSKQPSFLSVVGEFGIYLKNICDDRASPIERVVRQLLLNLYGKSGKDDILPGAIYSDTAKNIGNIEAPAFSLLGETVPSSFYENIDSSVIESGLLPRFFTLTYEGRRVDTNYDAASYKMPDGLKTLVGLLAEQAMKHNIAGSKATPTVVEADSAALTRFRKFGAFATAKINDTRDRVVTELWNRAHLNALKLASLIAVGFDLVKPVIREEWAEWAIQLVVGSIENTSEHFKSGRVGSRVSGAFIRGQLTTTLKYYGRTEDEVLQRTYRITTAMRGDAIISRRMIAQHMTNNNSALNKLPADARKRVIDAVVDEATSDGVLLRCSAVLMNKHNLRGDYYQIIGPS